MIWRVSCCPEYHTPTPVFYSAITNPFRRYVPTQGTPNPTPKHPFCWPEVESGQKELPSGQNDPQLGKMFEKWENFSRSGQKKNIHVENLLESFLVAKVSIGESRCCGDPCASSSHVTT